MRVLLPLILLSLARSNAAAAPLAADPGVSDSTGFEPLLSAEQRRERAGLIRDAAASVGMTNGVLLAGIAQAETTLAHCWSEATWACQGPPSSSCGGDAVIAGSADGPCSARQG